MTRNKVAAEEGSDADDALRIQDEALSTRGIADIGHDREVQGGSIPAAIFGIVKAMVGPAILYLPHSFADAGYAFALIALVGALMMYIYSSNRLLENWRIESARKESKSPVVVSSEPGIELVSLLKRSKSRLSDTDKDKDSDGASTDLSFLESDIENEKLSAPTTSNALHVESTCKISYPLLAFLAYGETGEIIVRAGIALMQLGVCLTYFIFVPHNLSTSIKTLWDLDVPMFWCLFGMVVVEIPLSCIKDIRRLTCTNVIANFLILFGLLSCLWLALGVQSPDGKQATTQTMVSKLSKLEPLNERWYLFVGTSVLLFEGSITLCIPLQEAVQGKEARSRFPAVYRRTISTIVAFYSFFGITCWSAFGDDVKTVLTTSLPEGVLTTSVQLVYSLAVIFTFPLQIFPALDIIMQSVTKLLAPTKELSPFKRCLVVTIVLSSLSIIAVMEMDNLGHVVSLMGSLLGCPLAFVFPPLIHNRIVADPGKRLQNLVVSGFGLFAMIGATFSTLATWNEAGEGRRYYMMR